MSEVAISGLNIYPIKSASGIAVESARVVQTGLEYDRQFMLVDEAGEMITQRTADIGPKLVHVQPSFGTYSESIAGSYNGRLHVDIAGHGSTEISMFLPRHRTMDDLDLVDAKLHGKDVTGAVASREANEFFSEYLGSPVRLLRIISAHARVISRQKPGAANTTGFADGYPMLLTSQASLADLNAQSALAETHPNGVAMDRFRANIEVDGEDLPAYDEDYWRFIRLGGQAGAHVVKPCVRCVIPDTDQATGEVGKAVRRALAANRKGVETDGDAKGVFFGQNLNHTTPGVRVSIGDQVHVVERSETANVSLAA